MVTTKTMPASITETDPAIIDALREVSRRHADLHRSRMELARLDDPSLELSLPPLKEGFYAVGYDKFHWNWLGKHPGAVLFEGHYTSVEHGNFTIKGSLYPASPLPLKGDCVGASVLTVFNLAPEKFCDHQLAAAYAADTSTVGYVISYNGLVATSVGAKTHGMAPAMGGKVTVSCSR